MLLNVRKNLVTLYMYLRKDFIPILLKSSHFNPSRASIKVVAQEQQKDNERKEAEKNKCIASQSVRFSNLPFVVSAFNHQAIDLLRTRSISRVQKVLGMSSNGLTISSSSRQFMCSCIKSSNDQTKGI